MPANHPEPTPGATVLDDLAVVDALGEAETDTPRGGSALLRRTLIALDATAIALAWTLAAVVTQSFGDPADVRPFVQSAALVLAATCAGFWLLSSQRLYLARVCSVRTVEITRLTKVAVLLGIVVYAGASALDVSLSELQALGGTIGTLLYLLLFRSGYRAWLRARRAEGRYTRPVLLVGINDETVEIEHLLDSHPELGFSVGGVVGPADAAERHGYGERWSGPVDDVRKAVHDTGATGVVVVASALPSVLLNRTIREVMQLGVHVHMTSGLRGFDHRRLRAQPLAYEPILYLEPASFPKYQMLIKRAIDLVITGISLLLSVPVLLLAAIAIKLDDRGPIFFRQDRVGRNGRTFRIYKLRTMVADAEQQLELLRDQNERQGPLFKLTVDPRVTRVGRVLRATSIDELPQLFNVLRGEMSLVGPRPALPREVADFDESLATRTQVLPGITGLWQVEARDNASFATYRRLDLFYVENWSVTLDLVVLIATIESEIAHLLRNIFGHRRHADAAAA